MSQGKTTWPIGAHRYVAAVLLLVLISGCASPARNCVPVELTRHGPLVDPNAGADEYRRLDSDIVDMLSSRLGEDGGGPSGKKYQVLALSGGGVYGAYTAGVLNGWSAAGTRPTFDVVTGISTGSLMATFAFLGPEYDDKLARLYTTVRSSDIYRRRLYLSLLLSDAAASSEPLRRLIDAYVDASVVRAVAQAHASGRRLYVGTTNLDSHRLVIWDMGAIAASGRPDALELYRKVLLASAAVPGFLPPVPIDVAINGRRYTELHVDGGTTAQVFLRGSMLKLDQEATRAGRRPLSGSDVYVIVAGKLYADPGCVEPRATRIASEALTTLTYAETRSDLVRIYTLALLTGMRFHLTALPQDHPAPEESLSFDPAPMRQMYAAGYHAGLTGQGWRGTPPGTDAAEQVLPRTGTEFLAPVAVPGPVGVHPFAERTKRGTHRRPR